MNYTITAAIIFLIAGPLIGCTGNESNLRHQLKDANNDLYSCKSKLGQYELRELDRNQDLSPLEPEQPQEPAYTTVEYYEVDGTRCDHSSLDYSDDADPGCGISFWGCKDGIGRRCMTNVKYKIKEEQKLVEQE